MIIGQVESLISRNKYVSIYMFKDCCNKKFILSWISQSYVSHAWHLNINLMFEEKEDTSICQHLHFPIYTLYFPLQQTFFMWISLQYYLTYFHSIWQMFHFAWHWPSLNTCHEIRSAVKDSIIHVFICNYVQEFL